MIDPNERISVDEALKHPYVNVWFDDTEVRKKEVKGSSKRRDEIHRRENFPSFGYLILSRSFSRIDLSLFLSKITKIRFTLRHPNNTIMKWTGENTQWMNGKVRRISNI